MAARLRQMAAGVAFLGLWGGGASGAELPSGPAAAVGVALQVDPAASWAFIKVTSSTRFGHDHGVSGRLASGSVTPGAAGDLVFDMRTFVADRPEARSYVGLTAAVSASDAQKTTATMLGRDVLDVARFPTARYVIKAAIPADGQPAGAPGRYQLQGEFTLHGVVRAVPLTAVLEKTSDPNALRMRCAFAVQQSQFGMRPYTALGGIVGVNDLLQIWGDLTLRPAAPAAAAAPGRNPAR